MIPIERKSNNKNRITKTRDFLQEITEKLKSSKDIDGKGKRTMKKQFNKKNFQRS